MALSVVELKLLIQNAIPDAQIEIKSLVDDGDHYQAIVYSNEFIGKSRIAQHQMVYKALGDKMGGQLHALSLTTKIKED